MRKILLLFILYTVFAENAFCQFSGVLAGYPLVTSGWNYGGDAIVVDSTIQLTAPTTTQAGYVYYNTVVDLTTCAQFTVKFDFKIVPSVFSEVADGIAFWYISNPPSGFIAGGGIGLPSNPDGLILILDTYDNDGNGNNPLETLVGYTGSTAGYTEGSATGVLAPVVPNQNFIDDGSWHHCELDYNAGNINVYFNNNPVPSITAYYPLGIAGYFGFSASTGAAYSTQSVKDVYINAAGISPTPTVTSPLSYCQYAPASSLSATGTGPFHWFTTDTATIVALPGAPTPVTTSLDTTTYYVRQGTGTCISPADSIRVIVNPIPGAPGITGDTFYCTGTTFVPFTVTATGTLKWYDSYGGPGSPTAPIVNTSIPGSYTFYVTQTINGCEGPRDSIHVTVNETPPAPVLTGGSLAYCQYVPFIPMSVTGSNVLWYTAPTGGTGSATAPTINTAVAGTYNNYVTQTNSGCTSPRGEITVVVHPKPAPPVITPTPICQYLTPGPESATPSGTGDHLLWYGPGVTVATSTAPTPGTLSAPDTIDYYVTETSSFACVSDSSLDVQIVKKQPAPPVTRDVWYCQDATAQPLNAQVDSAANSGLNWYIGGIIQSIAPTPPSADTTLPGNTIYYVTQTVNGCESDSATVTVTILYTPVFTISATQPYVCQYDSISVSYNGPELVAPSYTWSLPEGANFASGTHSYDDSVVVSFDSAVVNNYVKLTVSDDSGKCTSDTTIRINIISQPTAEAYTPPNVCLGDTVALGLSTRASDAYSYIWYVDYVQLLSSQSVTMVSANSSSGGPFSISWVDSGRHVIEVQTFSANGCKSAPTFDTINVHPAPDAEFKISSTTQTGCLDDTVQFTADVEDYNNSYQWAPAHSFNNVNTPAAWGRIEQANTIITLTVTDPFGCVATQSMEIDPNSCCTVAFPNAFTPNGDGKNDYFRPLYNGYHNFHVFEIMNRWGQIIFTSENSNVQWDGTYNGVPQDMGTYFYYLKYDCGGKTIEAKGDVILVR